MANCYNIAGNEVSCTHNQCIGTDCFQSSGSSESAGGVQWTSTDFGLSDLYDMSEDEFQQWFAGYLPWGEEFTGLTIEGADNPTLVDQEGAEYLATLFQGYDWYQELYIRGQQQETAAEQQELYDVWDMNTDLLLASKAAREDNLKNKKKDLFLAQEDFNTQVSSWDNKAAILKAVGSVQDAKNKDTKEGIANAKNELYLEDTVDMILDDFYNKQNFNDLKMDNRVDLLDIRHTNKVLTDQLDKDQKALVNAAKKTSNIMKGELSALDSILDLRDEYEASVYDQLALMGSTGAFFETPYETVPENWECSQWADDGSCYGWDLSDALIDNESDGDASTGGDLCMFNCADGCSQQADCNGLASGWYATSANCCPGNDPDPGGGGGCVPSYNILGQCISCC